MITHHISPVSEDTPISQILQLFEQRPNLQSLPVVDMGKPIGLISRKTCYTDTNQACSNIMNRFPLLIEQSTPIHMVASQLSHASNEQLCAGFIVTEQGMYQGVGHVQEILELLSQPHVTATDHLLLLNNSKIFTQIERLLTAKNSFALCRVDLNHFAPYNQVFGYQQGNELIKFTYQVLKEICQADHDLVCHMGSDNFMVLFQSADWQERSHAALKRFAQESSRIINSNNHFGYETTNRQGRLVHHTYPTLSIGAIYVLPHMFPNAYEVLAAASTAKKIAQSKGGNNLFIEQRSLKKHPLPI